MKTQEEVEALKLSWSNDPCWDLEHTEGFEEHYTELKDYSDKMKNKWSAESEKRHANAPAFPLAINFGCDEKEVNYGISKRLYIATQIAAGYVSNPDITSGVMNMNDISEKSYLLADKLLRQENL